MKDLDQKDRTILFELDRDSRQSINQLAKKTRLSRDVVRYRIKQLEEKDIINGYYTLIDFSKLGYDIVRLYLKLQNTDQRIEEEMVKEFMRHPSVIIVYRTDGRYELAVGFIVKNLREYQEAYEEVIKPYKQYVTETNHAVFNDFLQYPRSYLSQEEHNTIEWSTGSYTPYDYDHDDLRILDQLAEDARKPITDIAKKLHLPVTTTTYRLKQLEKRKVIVAYRALIDFHKLGMEYYKVDLTLEDLAIKRGLGEFARTHPSIIYQDVTAGSSDFEFDAELPTQELFYELIERIKALFPGKIRSYFYYKAIHIYKYSYFPKKLLKTS